MNSYVGPFFGLLSSCTWAYGSARYSRLTRDYTPFAVNFTRALVALPLFVIAVFVAAGGWSAGMSEFAQVRPSIFAWLAVGMTASYGLGDSLFFLSSRILGLPSALAIGSSYPLLTALAGVVFRGEKLGVWQVLGLILVVGGVVLVILKSATALQKPKFLGVVLAILTMCLWALHGYTISHVSHELSPAVANTLRMIFALGLCTVFGFLLARGKPMVLPCAVIKSSLWLFVVEAFGGSYFYLIAMRYSTLAVAATLTSLAPVLSVPVALALKLERFSFWRTFGVCTVVVGVWLLIGTGK